MKCLIPIETASRELLYKIHLIRGLVKHGFQCYLGNKASIYHIIKNEKDFVYLDMGYHIGSSGKLYQLIKKNNGYIINLDEEGAIDFPNNSTLKKRYTKELFQKVDRVFFWGKSQYSIFNKIFDKNKVIVSGHPRFELLKPNFHFLYEQSKKEIEDKFGSFILINTNMGFGNNIRGDDFVRKNYVSRFKDIDKKIAFDKKKLKVFISFVIELSKNTKRKIIVRPHPEEDSSVYLNINKYDKNIEVVYQGSVIPWILASDFVIHPDCTTAIEAFIMGKKPISILPKDYPEKHVTWIPIRVSENFISIRDAINFILDNLKKTKEKTLLKPSNTLQDYFSLDRSPTDIIVKDISNNFKKNIISNYSKLSLTSILKLKLVSFRSKLVLSKANKLHKKKVKGFDFKKIIKILKVFHKNSTFEIDIVSLILFTIN